MSGGRPCTPPADPQTKVWHALLVPCPTKYHVSSRLLLQALSEATEVLRELENNKLLRGKDYPTSALVQLRQTCGSSGVQVKPQTERGRDEMFRAAVEAALAACCDERPGLGGELPQRFVAGLAQDLGGWSGALRGVHCQARCCRELSPVLSVCLLCRTIKSGIHCARLLCYWMHVLGRQLPGWWPLWWVGWRWVGGQPGGFKVMQCAAPLQRAGATGERPAHPHVRTQVLRSQAAVSYSQVLLLGSEVPQRRGSSLALKTCPACPAGIPDNKAANMAVSGVAAKLRAMLVDASAAWRLYRGTHSLEHSERIMELLLSAASILDRFPIPSGAPQMELMAASLQQSTTQEEREVGPHGHLA